MLSLFCRQRWPPLLRIHSQISRRLGGGAPMSALHDSLQAALLKPLGLRPPHLINVLSVRADLHVSLHTQPGLCSCKQLTEHLHAQHRLHSMGQSSYAERMKRLFASPRATLSAPAVRLDV